MTQVSLSGNAADIGGGIAFWDGIAATLSNCIMWGNVPGNYSYNLGPAPTITYSDVQGGYTGAGNIDANPLFVDADGADDVVSTLDDDLRLQLTSPAIDAGDNTAVPTGITTDLDGKPRFFDVVSVADTGNGTPPLVDMGAYEAYVAPFHVYLPVGMRSYPK